MLTDSSLALNRRASGVSSAGLAQYSGDPKTQWHLNAHLTKTSLLEAIANLPYKGGNTMTGGSGLVL